MTENDIQPAFATRILPLDFWQKINHFSLPIVLLWLPFLVVFFSLYNWFYGIVTPVDKVVLVVVFGVLPLFISAITYFTQKRALMFESAGTTLSSDEIKSVIKSVGKELKWHIETFDANFVQARTHPPFLSGSWGEMITIVIGKGEVLVNSICDPEKHTSVVSFGRNKQNVNTFTAAIEQQEYDKSVTQSLNEGSTEDFLSTSDSIPDSIPQSQKNI